MPRSAQVASERVRAILDAVTAMSSDLTVEGLLDRILRQAGDLVDAERGFIDVLGWATDRRIGSFAAYNVPGVVDDEHPGRQLLVDLLERPDARVRSGASAGDAASTFIGVPIKIHDRVFGNLYLIGKRTGRGFTHEDEEVAHALASAAGVVIENARLHEQGERQRLWLEAASEITTSLLAPISRSAALELVADRARLVAGADFVALLMPHEGDDLVVRAVSGVPSAGVLDEVVGPGPSLVGEAVRLDQPVVVPRTELDPRYRRDKTTAWPDLGSVMVLPLRGSTTTGVLVVGWFKGHQTERWELDPDVPQGFANQAALVLQVAKAQEDQARLAVFEDRDRIGRDLHDLVIQRLFGIGLMLDNTTKLIESRAAVDRLSSAIDDIDQTIKDIRRTIFALSSTAESTDIRAQLDEVVLDASKLLGFTPRLTLVGPVDSVIDGETREQLVAVLRETLSNIVRHADATQVSVRLSVVKDVHLEVEDDGQGLGSGTSGNGLRNIRERAELLGGTCAVTGGAGVGTTVLWTVPRRI